MDVIKKDNKVEIRWVHKLTWFDGTLYISAHRTSHEDNLRKVGTGQILPPRTTMTVGNIIRLLAFFLKNTYFFFPGKYYEQLEGSAIRSSISPIAANLFMEHFETNSCNPSSKPPSLCLRFVDDAVVVQKTSHNHEFLKNINLVTPSVKFTAEETRSDGSMPFLDMLVMSQPEGALSTTVCRKSTHTDLYLQWDNHL